MKEFLNLPQWLRHYQRSWLGGDLTAGVIVTVMLIPQSLAYAMLAGLPPQMGLYASILPIVAYALFGSSMTLAVGPVAVASLMTASALQPLAAAGSAEYVTLAIQLSLISGVMLLVFGALRLGFFAYFLSHPVISGFISGSAILIAIGQLKHIFGVSIPGGNVLDTLTGLLMALPRSNQATVVIGMASLLFLFLTRRMLARVLTGLGVPAGAADLMTKLAPMVAVFASTAAVGLLRLDQTAGVSIVGHVPQGLPQWNLTLPGASTLGQLWLPALLIALVGFVESVSVAQSLALKRKQRIKPDRELLGLGAANIASAFSGGFPVTGGFARSVVNFAAGAQTPLAGVISALLMGLVIVSMTGLFHYLPHAVLAATIIMAVISLIDVHTLREAWQFDRADALALIATALGVVAFGVEAGILTGVGLSLGALVWRSTHPHMAVVGRMPGTEHYRNVKRHSTETVPGLLALRIDESLFFANINVVEDRIEALLAADPAVQRVVLICSAVNRVDTTAMEVLRQIESGLAARGIEFTLAEVKGPVMDRLSQTDFGQRLDGRVFVSVHDAFVDARKTRSTNAEVSS